MLWCVETRGCFARRSRSTRGSPRRTAGLSAALRSAVAELRRAVELDPLSISYRLSLTSGLRFTRDYAGGIAEARKVLESCQETPGFTTLRNANF